MQYILVSTLLVGAVASVSAVELNYEVGNSSSVVANNVDPGLKVLTALDPGLSLVSFTLNDGEAYMFPFFRIKADETSVDDSADGDLMPITATLDFDVPDEDAVIGGDTHGEPINITLNIPFVGKITVPGPYDTAFLTWDGPVTITANDRTFEVALNDVEFSRGSGLDFDLGNHNSSLVNATVRQISSNVPDGGATALMMGSVLFGFGALGRRFRR